MEESFHCLYKRLCLLYCQGLLLWSILSISISFLNSSSLEIKSTHLFIKRLPYVEVLYWNFKIIQFWFNLLGGVRCCSSLVFKEEKSKSSNLQTMYILTNIQHYSYLYLALVTILSESCVILVRLPPFVLQGLCSFSHNHRGWTPDHLQIQNPLHVQWRKQWMEPPSDSIHHK